MEEYTVPLLETTHEKGKKYKRINTPFGYFGAKNNIALKLCENLPPHNCWVEVFCGSAALTMAKAPAPIEVLNDIDNEVVNLFKQLRSTSNELCQMISLTPYAREELEIARNIDPKDSDLERARKFLVQAMFAINGVFGKEKGGFSYSQSYSRNEKDARVSRWYNLPERIQKVVERLRGVRIENRDALEIIKMFQYRPATLLYLDPPYLGERTEGYSVDANDEGFHRTMLELANKSKCMIFISTYENDLYEKFLGSKKKWTRKTINTTTKDSKGNSHSRTEVVWTNYWFEKALSNNEIPIRLSKKEIKENKLNPVRKL